MFDVENCSLFTTFMNVISISIKNNINKPVMLDLVDVVENISFAKYTMPILDFIKRIIAISVDINKIDILFNYLESEECADISKSYVIDCIKSLLLGYFPITGDHKKYLLERIIKNIKEDDQREDYIVLTFHLHNSILNDKDLIEISNETSLIEMIGNYIIYFNSIDDYSSYEQVKYFFIRICIEFLTRLHKVYDLLPSTECVSFYLTIDKSTMYFHFKIINSIN